TVEFKSAIDGSVTNDGVARYRELNGDHFKVVEKGKVGENGMYLLAQAHQSLEYVAQVVRTAVYQKDFPPAAARTTNTGENHIEQIITIEVAPLESVRVEKILSFHTSKDVGNSDPLTEAKTSIYRAGNFKELLKAHRKSWGELWKRFDICIEGNMKNQMLLRLHIFHLLQTASLNSIKLDIGVPARGWHGEAYRGHIFWDEIYIFPFLNLRVPEITRTLMMYRYRRLNEARANAKESGYRGAMFPWQSGSNGREESQELHLNPESDQWIPDNTYLQRHISADIVYNIMQYYAATHDKEFMTLYGAEIVLEVANFFGSKAKWDDEKERYVINNIVGPDEYHTQYPDSEKPGIDNNAYTNVMAAWVLKTACEVFNGLSPLRKEELRSNLHISEEDFIRWDQVSRKLYIPFIEDGIIAQFEGYEKLEDLDLDKYRKEHGEFLRIDRILQAEGDDPNRYKTSKQADVLMLFYLFSNDELQKIFEHMGYDFDPEMLSENIKYYNKRTSHGSTLSKLVHSWVTARSDRNKSWESFEKALISDFEDVQGGTTSEGIHLGAMAGTVDLMQRCYSGLSMRNNTLYLDPVLPEDLDGLYFKIRYRSKWLDVRINRKKMEVAVIEGWGDPVKLGFGDEVYELSPGDQKTFNLKTHE
ncbi:MAG: glycoside hydrolase family 65 protein, partial [Flavobacteriales bacterium]|nr:glycoside hydrolase family 65 protein [Flavobacteriales bacterium]